MGSVTKNMEATMKNMNLTKVNNNYIKYYLYKIFNNYDKKYEFNWGEKNNICIKCWNITIILNEFN